MAVEIADWNDLDNVRNDLSGDYVLVNDLDSETDGYAGIGDDFEPIGDGGEFSGMGVPFEGTFDGGGFAIEDLVIDFQERGVGLFGDVHNSDSIIENLSVSGSVSDAGADDSNTGGLVGIIEDGTVQNCAIHVDVTAPDGGNVGGLVGQIDQNGAIIDSYATGSVEGGDGVGGLVGFQRSDNSTAGVRRCYSYGTVTGDTDVGGFTGKLGGNVFREGYIFDSYVDIDESGQDDAIGSIREVGESDVTELSTSEMQGSEAEANMDGFDFSNTWDSVLESDDDTTADGYPILLALDRENQLEAQGIFQDLEPPEPPENLTAELL